MARLADDQRPAEAAELAGEALDTYLVTIDLEGADRPRLRADLLGLADLLERLGDDDRATRVREAAAGLT